MAEDNIDAQTKFMLQLLDDNKPQLVKSLIDNLVNKTQYQVTEIAFKMITGHITDWITKNVIPEVINKLVQSKEGLISVAVGGADELVKLMTEAMVKQAKSVMESDYKRQELLAKLFAR